MWCWRWSSVGGPRSGGGHGRRGRGGSSGGPQRPEVANARALVARHELVDRVVEEIPGGVRTTTTSEDPETAELLRNHAEQMKALVEGGGHIRMWDPLFVELLASSDLVEMSVRPLDDGVEVTETSSDPWVETLIRAHAEKVSDMVSRGREAAHEPTPLPEIEAAEPGGS